MNYFYAIKQIFKITFTIIIFVSLPLVVFTLITSKTEIIGGIKSFVVLTGSMEPAIPVGSIIYTRELSGYNSGDVIAFEKGGKTVTHRIVSVEQKNGSSFYKTKGDANSAADSDLIADASVLGRAEIRALNAGKLVLFLKTVPGFLGLIVFPALILIGFELMNIKKEIEKEVRKKFLREIGQNIIRTQ